MCCFSLKVEYDKLANEKTEMQRHYVMVRWYKNLSCNYALIYGEYEGGVLGIYPSCCCCCCVCVTEKPLPVPLALLKGPEWLFWALGFFIRCPLATGVNDHSIVPFFPLHLSSFLYSTLPHSPHLSIAPSLPLYLPPSVRGSDYSPRRRCSRTNAWL